MSARPMILSYTFRFLFIKTRKTAGTSIEAILRRYSTGPSDVITPITPVDELACSFGPQNYLRGDVGRSLREDGLWEPEKSCDFYNHIPLSAVRAYVGAEIADTLFKFAFVRNPWDRNVSLYHWQRSTGMNLPFRDWIMQSRAPAHDLFAMVSLHDGPAMDFVGRYEYLHADFDTVCRRIGIDFVPLPKLKVGLRPTRHYREYYDAQTRDHVSALCADEIVAFGYTF
jgi:hypothetical protein